VGPGNSKEAGTEIRVATIEERHAWDPPKWGHPADELEILEPQPVIEDFVWSPDLLHHYFV
jgi:hypothetical protein